MKKIIKVFFISCVTIITVFGLASCGEKTKMTVAPGCYMLELGSYKKFIDIKCPYSDQNSWDEEYKEARSYFYTRLDVSPQLYYYTEGYNGILFPKTQNTIIDSFIFEDCYITVDFTVNDQKKSFTEKIYNDGTATIYIEFDFNPTYKFNVSYSISDMHGYVYAKYMEGLTFFYEGNKYQLVGENECELYNNKTYDGPYGSSQEVIHLKDYAVLDNVTVPFNGQNAFCGRQDGFFTRLFNDRTMKDTKVIIFDGKFTIDNLVNNGRFGESLNYLDLDLKDIFPNLQIIAIKDLSMPKEFPDESSWWEYDYKYREIGFYLPEGGVTFYVGDNTYDSCFTKSLQKANFVNGIHTWDEFDLSSYIGD